MAAYRMAKGESRTDEVLAFHSPGQYKAEGTGGPRQTALDHRTELRGTEAGTRTGALRRPGLARVPPSRHALYRGIRLPPGREKPFFPLGTRRQSRTIGARSPARLPPARLKSDPSGIIRSLLRRFAYNSLASLSDSFPAVLFVDPNVCNTVVLGCGIRDARL